MLKSNWTKLILVLLIPVFIGCMTVDVTKTGKGIYEATNPADIEILGTEPERDFVELAAISTSGWKPNQTAKMHNALRAKSAPLGASAVLLLHSGILNNRKLWSTGVAIRYTE